MRGHRGYAYRGWGHPGGFIFFPILPLLLVGFILFGVIKFLWPLLLLGFVFFVVRSAMHGHRGHGRRHGFGRGWGHHGWQGQWGHDWAKHHGRGWGWDDEGEKPKRKNDDSDDDEKPKRDGRTLYV
jgi:hypothetical protein